MEPRTFGYCWISAGETEILRYSEPWLKAQSANAHQSEYAEDYASRFWEYVLRQCPKSLTPIPADLWERVRTADQVVSWLAAADEWLEVHDPTEDGDSHVYDVYRTATHWYHARRLWTGQFKHGPRIWFLQVEDQMLVRWDNRTIIDIGVTVWSASVGEYQLSVDDFIAEVRLLHDRLATDMRMILDAIIAAHPRPGLSKNIRLLGEEQEAFERALDERLLQSPAQTDWDAVRRALATLGL